VDKYQSYTIYEETLDGEQGYFIRGARTRGVFIGRKSGVYKAKDSDRPWDMVYIKEVFVRKIKDKATDELKQVLQRRKTAQKSLQISFEPAMWAQVREAIERLVNPPQPQEEVDETQALMNKLMASSRKRGNVEPPDG
jgi:hypothetical protein